jgi:hypothetical protein
MDRKDWWAAPVALVDMAAGLYLEITTASINNKNIKIKIKAIKIIK